MTELFTMVVLAANIIVASAFARFATASNLRTPTLSKAAWSQKSRAEYAQRSRA